MSKDRGDIRIRHHNRHSNKDAANKSKQETFSEPVETVEAEELVPIIPKELFTYLSTYKSSICVSIILPTHASGVQVNEHTDITAFKTALQEVEKTLSQKNIDHGTIKKILQPGYDLLRDDQLWYNLTNGLAVYIADDFVKFIRLPGTVNREVLVNSSFAVMPLVPFMVRKEFFYILTISKKNAKFYRADMFGIEHIPVDELPVGVDDVVHFENKDDEKLFRMSNNGGGASYHGQGAGKPDEKQNIALYLEEVDDTLWKTHLHRSNAPLLLAGVEYLIPIYKSVTDYNNIWPEALTGNHQYDDAETLYQQAMSVMQPYFDQNQKNALEEFGNKSATALTSLENKEVIPAAYYGRISHLFVEKNSHIWGTFDELSSELKITNSRDGDAENLADKAVAKTIETGGSVFILDKEQMPGTGQMAAIFRYPSTK